MNEKAMQNASKELNRMITSGDISPYTQSEVETIHTICKDFYYYNVEQRTTPIEKVKDFFVKCGFEVKQNGIGWTIYNR